MTRVGDMEVGDRFVTRLTHRSGVVLDASQREADRAVTVKFEDNREEKNIHVDVEVQTIPRA